MHQVCQVVLNLALVDVHDLETVLDEQLLALDGLLGLSAIVALNLAQQG